MANTPFTQSLRPLCLPRATIKLTRSPLDAQRRQHGCPGHSEVVHKTFNNRHRCHGRHQVLNVFKTVTGGSLNVWWLNVRSNEAEGTQRHRGGCRMDAQWSAIDCHVIYAFYCKAQSLNVGDVSASLVLPLCHLCVSNSVLWTMTVKTTLLPFSDHGDAWASMSMVLPSFCLLYATCCASTPCL